MYDGGSVGRRQFRVCTGNVHFKVYGLKIGDFVINWSVSKMFCVVLQLKYVVPAEDQNRNLALHSLNRINKGNFLNFLQIS